MNVNSLASRGREKKASTPAGRKWAGCWIKQHKLGAGAPDHSKSAPWMTALAWFRPSTSSWRFVIRVSKFTAMKSHLRSDLYEKQKKWTRAPEQPPLSLPPAHSQPPPAPCKPPKMTLEPKIVLFDPGGVLGGLWLVQDVTNICYTATSSSR